jgi:hypothetical protein
VALEGARKSSWREKVVLCLLSAVSDTLESENKPLSGVTFGVDCLVEHGAFACWEAGRL